MLEEFPIKFSDKEHVTSPAQNDMFSKDSGKILEDDKRELFHRTVAQNLFVSKRGRQDIQPIISVLCTRVKQPTESNWDKLVWFMRWLHKTRHDTMIFNADNGLTTV